MWSTGPSAEREVPEAANREGPGQVADNFATEEQSGSNQEQPEESVQIQKVLNLFQDMTGGLQSRAAAVLAEIQVPINSLFLVINQSSWRRTFDGSPSTNS